MTTHYMTHTRADWQRLSVARALAFRRDARRTRLYFQTRPGSYTDVALIAFLRRLKRHFRSGRVVLLWDRLGAHKSEAMRAYLGRQHAWLTVEPLPGYAPELNPVDQVWGNVTRGNWSTSAPTTSQGCGTRRTEASHASDGNPTWLSPFSATPT